MTSDMRPTYQRNFKVLNICTSALNLWWQAWRAPRKETAGSGTPALEFKTELIES